VQVDVWWGDAEPRSPGCYELGGVVAAAERAARRGLKVRVALHFHAGNSWEQQQDDAAGRRRRHRRRQRHYHPLPAWVRAAGAANPDIYFRDAQGGTSERECLTLGIDDVPALAGRTATEAYAGLARAVASALAARGLWGTAVRDVVVGLGPGGELRYPSHPDDGGGGGGGGGGGDAAGRWAYPCVGEFQCYDRHLLASLAAAAHERGQPHWGLGGPHDAVGGRAAASPAQLGFFHPQGGSWSSEYGAFFLEWYGKQLVGHACRVLDAVAGATAGVVAAATTAAPPSAAARFAPPRLHARLPAVHWWHGSPERSAELTAGYFSPPAVGEPYLDALLALARRGVGVELAVVAPASLCASPGGGGFFGCAAAAASSSSSPGEQPPPRHPHPHAAADDPRSLLREQRGTAAAVGVPALTLVARPRGLGAGGAAGAAEGRAALEALAAAAAAGGGAEYRGVELVLPEAVTVDGAFADLWLGGEEEEEEEQEQEEEEEAEEAEEAALVGAAVAPAAGRAAAPSPTPPSSFSFADETEEDPASYFDHHGVAHQARNAYGVPAELIAQHRAALEQRRMQLQHEQQRQRQQQAADKQPEPALRA
jgi:hypothetical protein